MFKRKFFPLLFVLFVAYMFGFASVYAQDTPATTAEPTSVVVAPPAPTDAPVVVSTPAPELPPVNESGPSDRTLLAIGSIVTGILGGLFIFLQHRRAGDLIDSLNKVMDNKAVQDEAHARYTQQSVTVQQAIQFAEAFFKLAGGLNLPTIDPLLDKVAEFGDIVTTQKNTVASSN